MATRSHIGLKNLDDTVSYIYCHHDGYPSYNGRILIENYTTVDKVKELLALGDISSLGENIGSKHNWNNPPEGECNTYHRDRGERLVTGKNQQFQDLIGDDNVDYAYIFDGDYWECYRTYNGELIDIYEKFSNSQVD
jgi:hypothetical protein